MTQPGPGGQHEDDAFATIVEHFHNTTADVDHAGGGPEAALVLTELGFTERFIRKYHKELLFVPNVGWHVYRDGRWALDEMNFALNATRFLTDQIQQEFIDGLLIDVTENELRMVVRNVSKIATRRSVLAAAEVDPRMNAPVTELNKDPWVLNLEDGTLELKTGVQRKWDPADRITQRANVRWEEDAECPRFDALLAHAFPGAEGEDMIKYLWRVIGYSLTGVTSAQAFFFLWGVKGSSKSTITECLVEMLGGYAHMLNEYALVGSEQQHPTWIVDLIGKRLAVKDELGSVKKINTARLNSMVGGAKQRARRMARDEVDVPISCKIWITTNPRPPMGDGSDGVWRRIHPIHFKNAIARDEMIPDYGKMLAVEEGAGILKKAVEALWEALEIGEGVITFKSLGTPASVIAGAEDYQEIDDTYGAFFDDIITKSDDPDSWISNVDIMRVHESWCGQNRVDTMHPTQLSKALTERGFVRAKPCKAVTADGKKMTQRGFIGVKVNIDGGLTMMWNLVAVVGSGTVTGTVTDTVTT